MEFSYFYLIVKISCCYLASCLSSLTEFCSLRCRTWDHHDILQVDAQYNDTNKACSTSAVLTSIASYSGRKTTAVHATDSLTGQILRCEVFIDKISRIQIFHHSLKLDLDGLATLRIRAFDTEDNVFSSLAGLQFMWQLSPLSQTGDVAHRLLHVPLKQTALIDGEIEDQIELEQNGLESDLYVVRGVGAGQERVTAHFMEEGFENLSHIITLTVAEAVSLDPPSPLYMIPGTSLQFTLRALRRNEVKVVPLPSPHHRWSLDKSTVADVDAESGLMTARAYGSTVVTVEDLRLTGHQQTSTIHVVRPTSLVLALSPLLGKGVGAVASGKSLMIMSDSSWQVVAGRKYVVQVFAFSTESGNKPLLLTKDNELTLPSANPPYWKISKVPEAVVAEQGWRNCFLLEAGMEGNGTLVASLSHGVMVEDRLNGNWLLTNKQVLISDREVTVCAQVKIIRSRYGDYLGLPWAPGHEQEHPLFAEGGCGKSMTDYDWSSSNPAVATVNADGLIRTTGLGRTVIRATALGDVLNDDEIIVEVSYPTAIGIVPGLPVEVEVGSYIPAAVSLRDRSGLEYASCDTFNKVVKWGLFGGDGLFSIVKEEAHRNSSAQEKALQLIHPHACARTLISATRNGRATVRASLNVGEVLVGLTSPEIGQPFLEVSWPIAAFAPLTVKQASGGDRHGGYSLKSVDAGLVPLRSSKIGQLGELLLVPRSSMAVILRGGPERWRQGVEYVDSHVVISDQGTVSKENVEVSYLKDGGNWVYSIECKNLGNYTVNFYRGNLVGEDHPTESVSTVSLLVTCALPSAITLLADEPENTVTSIKVAAHAERDKDKSRVDTVMVINDRTIRIAAVALDVAGRPFSNASSLSLSWKLAGCKDLGQWVVEEHNSGALHGWEHMLALGNGAGKCFVRAEVQGFVSEHEGAFALLPFGKSFPKSHVHLLHDAVTIQLVAALRIEPNNFLLFHHPDSKASLSILGGTSEIEARANDSRVVDVILLDTRGLIVAARGSGDALITVRDAGLAIPVSANALVTVSDVAAVRMLLPDDTSLQVGSCMSVKVQAADNSGRIFDSSQFTFMSMSVHLQDGVLVTKPQATARAAANEFVVCGANVGLTTTLRVSVLQKHGKEVFSDFARISVYAPLSIHPSSLVLAPGAKYMLVVDGGPQTGVLFNFDATNPEVVKIDPSTGLLEAKAPGRATIQSQARSQSGELLSEAQLNMTVEVPVSMTLDVRGGQLAVGREITIFPHGLGENLFAFYEQCSNYKWSVENDQVLALAGVDGFSEEGKEIATSEDKRFKSNYWGKRDESAGTPYGFSARAIGKSAGRTAVTLSFNCQFHYNGQKVEKEFKPSGTVWVIPDPPLALGMGATWVLPPSYISSPLLPQLKNPVSEFSHPGRSGGSVIYSVMQEGCNDVNAITLTENGVIHTSEKTDLACIHARDRSSGRSEIAACVRVAEISSLTVGDGKLAVPVTELSVGTDQKLAVTLRDGLGVPFLESEVTVPIILDTNRADLISVKVADYENISGSTKVTILVQAMKQGSALVRITYRNNPHVVDWILINVGAYVFPRSPVLHIGNRLSFSILGKGLHGLPAGERGSWFSSNGSVVRVDSNTGEAHAIASGVATVSFNGTRLTTYTTVDVIGVSSVHFEVPTGIISNVPTPPEGYAFPVKFSDAHGRDIGIVGENREVSYSCRVQPGFIGEAKAWREPGGSVFQCVFLPYQPAKLMEAYQKSVINKQPASSKLLNGKLEFSMIARVEGASGIEGSAKAWFAGGFEMVDSLPSQLTLSSKAKEWEFAVVGCVNPDIVQPRITGRPEAFSIQLQNPKAETTGAGGRASYKLKVLDESKPITDSLVISSSLTGQEQELPIHFRPGKASVTSMTAQIVTSVLIILLLLILPLVFCARLLDVQRSSIAARTLDVVPVEEPAVNGVQFETTPLRHRTMGSPRTPQTPPSEGFGYRSPQQPYTEYVSRTLDSTPYFNREGYRKYDPSYTY
ncbi:hypothetical protein KC19_12G017200 [Ceratodon purpureus]|uniref:BIG2 domain-containing protein n=1 Tax=Ceratodon purpureus TaxID=3225 RepID=A0A8T0G321_CERPU|nr:hypothetical protein KC19_12G017200 [Ceratodon purpureus]